MDKIEKALEKLSERERQEAKRVMQLIIGQNFLGLDFKELIGQRHLYRVRKGSLRIIFKMDRSGTVHILSLERRADTTYRGL